MKCIVMFSGGLDSVVAAHLMKSQGLEVVALHFVLPFYAGLGRAAGQAERHVRPLGVRLRIEEEGEDYLPVLNSPSFGFGKHVNPCIDCRIHRLKKARVIMEEEGASFIATGEVIGQRPMSQGRATQLMVEKRAGLTGLLVRPLSAQFLPVSIPEQNGWLDREGLWAHRGRGRKPQLAYAARHGLTHGAPAGGCILTHRETALRFADLKAHTPDFSLDDLKLIAYGRLFRLTPTARLIVGRDEAENTFLERLVAADDYALDLGDIPGPFGILRGEVDPATLDEAAAILARYSKFRTETIAPVVATRRGISVDHPIAPASVAHCDGKAITYDHLKS